MEVAFTNLMAIIIGVLAIAISMVRPGNNSQAVRAVALIGILTMGFGLGLAALTWALLDIILPDTDITIKNIRAKKSRHRVA